MVPAYKSNNKGGAKRLFIPAQPDNPETATTSSKMPKLRKKCIKTIKNHKTAIIIVAISLSAIGAACLLGLYLAEGTNLIFGAVGLKPE